MKYAFQLGREPHISIAEIHALCETLRVSCSAGTRKGDFYIIEMEKQPDPSALMKRLGGSIKMAECVETAAGNNPNALAEHIAAYLAKQCPSGKISFSYAGHNSTKTGLTIKKKLKENGRNARYIEIKNTATIINNKLAENRTDLTHIGDALFATIATQDIEGFSSRDYGRPRFDDKSGMLPPKLARIMLNLSGAPLSAKLLDPFCGSGTVLTEAMSMGFSHLYGSDNAAPAVENTKKNLEWLGAQSGSRVSADIRQCDARELEQCFKKTRFDAIVTEPYLGKPLTGKESKHILEDQADRLSELYAASFQAFSRSMKRGDTVIFIIPAFTFRDGWVTVPAVERIKKAGFELVPFSGGNPTLLYHRPNQHVRREIFKFKKN